VLGAVGVGPGRDRGEGVARQRDGGGVLAVTGEVNEHHRVGAAAVVLGAEVQALALGPAQVVAVVARYDEHRHRLALRQRATGRTGVDQGDLAGVPRHGGVADSARQQDRGRDDDRGDAGAASRQGCCGHGG
jgi:hypothetical protein